MTEEATAAAAAGEEESKNAEAKKAEEESLSPEATELSNKIAELGASIAAAKKEGKPKEEWDSILQEMLSCKAKFKEITGREYGPPKKDDKKKNKQQQQQQGPSDKNKEKNAKKAAAKAEKEAKKAAQRAERLAREKAKADKLAGIGEDNFGDAPMPQSATMTDKVWTRIGNVTKTAAGRTVLVRGHLQNVRAVGKKGIFCLVRSGPASIQGVAFEGGKDSKVSAAMIAYIGGLPLESVVDVEGAVTVVETPVESATQSEVEIQISSFRCINRAKKALPFVMEDACRKDPVPETDVGAYHEEEDEDEEQQQTATPAEGTTAAEGGGDDDGMMVRVGQKMRLDYRWLDLRTPAAQAIFRIESMVGLLFREYLVKQDFVEMHPPRLIGGASEGGAEVFTLDYFGRPACLSMSPQLHKQMAAACGGFERVFCTTPAFRAENSHTRRHLCEFNCLDLEMVFYEHYHEVLQVFSDLFIYVFDGLKERCKAELEAVRAQFPFEDLVYSRPTLRLTYAEGCAMLREAGVEQNDLEDLSTENEKKLGDLVKEKYGTDFFFLDEFPLAVRPFYTMPHPRNPELSNSYDFFIRGQEILSGAQRIHEPELLKERATHHGIDLADIASYVNSFEHGAMPHGGGGIGLERVVMLYLGLPNIRKASWFPRDPKRIAP